MTPFGIFENNKRIHRPSMNLRSSFNSSAVSANRGRGCRAIRGGRGAQLLLSHAANTTFGLCAKCGRALVDLPIPIAYYHPGSGSSASCIGSNV